MRVITETWTCDPCPKTKSGGLRSVVGAMVDFEHIGNPREITPA
jgi:hypothetical protein